MRKSLPYPIYKIGIELEGGFVLGRPLGKNAEYHEDGSVCIESADVAEQDVEELADAICPGSGERAVICGCYECDQIGLGNLVTGEYVSPPFADWKSFAEWVEQTTPDVVNTTCGTHVHTSTKNLVYMSALLDGADELYDRLCDTWYKWGKRVLPKSSVDWEALKYRLDGMCSYARPKHNVDYLEGINEYGLTDRYQALNFQALHEHGTLENRLMPAFSKARYTLEATHIMLSLYHKVIQQYLKNKVLLDVKIYPTSSDNTAYPIVLPDLTIDQERNMRTGHEYQPYIDHVVYRDRPQEHHSLIGHPDLGMGSIIRQGAVKSAAARKGKKLPHNKKKLTNRELFGVSGDYYQDPYRSCD